MKYFALNLIAESPLVIRADHAPGGVANTHYITGSTLLGSLAAVYRLFHEEDSTEFERLFLSEQIAYPDLYPATFENPTLQNAFQQPIYPSPLTARTCKRFPGFLAMDDKDFKDERHGVRDSLFDWVEFELADKAGAADPLKSLRSRKYCSVCGEKHKTAMKPSSDFYRRDPQSASRYMSASARTRVQTHTGINRETGTVEESILYSRQVFDEQTRFWGLIKVQDDALTTPLTTFLQEVGKSGLVRLGTGRTRGLGKVRLEALPLEDKPYTFAAFQERLKNFDSKCRERIITASLEPARFYFALTLHSPTILHDEALRYRSGIDEKDLARLLDIPADNFSALYQAASLRRVTGWNELWGTPRLNEYAIETGSVFCFASSLEQTEPLLERLFHLEQKGIGQRRSEGFGRVCVSDPFHLEVELR